MRKLTYEAKSIFIEGVIIAVILGILFLLCTSCNAPKPHVAVGISMYMVR